MPRTADSEAFGEQRWSAWSPARCPNASLNFLNSSMSSTAMLSTRWPGELPLQLLLDAFQKRASLRKSSGLVGTHHQPEMACPAGDSDGAGPGRGKENHPQRVRNGRNRSCGPRKVARSQCAAA